MVSNYLLPSYFSVAGGTLLTYDVLCMLDQEVTYVWQNPLSLGKWLYFINRYLPFIYIFTLINITTTHNTAEQCRIKNTFALWEIFIGISLSEVILMIRTYAIWENRRYILITFCGLWLFTTIPHIILDRYAFASVEYVEAPPNIPVCLIRDIKSKLYLPGFGLLVISETTIVILTMIKAYQHLNHSRSTWVYKLYTDGLLFYIYILALSLINAFLFWFQLTPLLYPLQGVFHSIFCNRVLLLIFRQHAHINSTDSTFLSYSRPTSIYIETETGRPIQDRDAVVLSDLPGRPSFDVVLPAPSSDRDIP